MSLRGHDRGQSVVIGFLLVFTILVLAFSSYQAFAVPSQNQEVEAEHFQDVEEQFSQVRSNVINSVDSDEVRSTSIQLGTRYPTRTVALNPPPASGQLTTTEPGDVEFGPTTDDVCRDGGTAFSRSLAYTPGYSEAQEPQAIGYENRIVSREFASGALYDQRLVSSSSGNDKIRLFLLTGEVSENGINAYDLEVNGSDRYSTSLKAPVTIRLPSRFDATTWQNEILADRPDVTATSLLPGDDRIKLTFDGTGTGSSEYDVSCAVVGLDGDPTFTPPSSGSGGGGGGSGSSESTYDVQWDVSKIVAENSNVRQSSTEDIEVNAGETVDNPGVFVDVSNRSSGAPVDDAVVDAGHDGILQDIDDSEAVTGEQPGETPGFKLVVQSSPDTGVLYASSGDDVDSITVDVVAAAFESLEGTSSTQTGQVGPDEATFKYKLTSSSELTLTATEATGDTVTQTYPNTQEDVKTLDIPSSGNNVYPLELEADITGGECLEATLILEIDSATLSNDDWRECTP
jgi:hypothetical protein